MPNASITHTWADGDTLSVDIYVENDFPDCVAEAKAQALQMYATALGVTVAVLAVDEEPTA